MRVRAFTREELSKYSGSNGIIYIAYQGKVYVLAFIAYLTGLWTPTFTSIMILFGVDIIIDSILTVYYAIHILFPKTWRRELGENATKVNKLV